MPLQQARRCFRAPRQLPPPRPHASQPTPPRRRGLLRWRHLSVPVPCARQLPRRPAQGALPDAGEETAASGGLPRLACRQGCSVLPVSCMGIPSVPFPTCPRPWLPPNPAPPRSRPPQVFHPCMDEAGHVDMSLLGDDWRPDMCAVLRRAAAGGRSVAGATCLGLQHARREPAGCCGRGGQAAHLPESPEAGLSHADVWICMSMPCTCSRNPMRRSIKHIIYGLWRLFLLPESGACAVVAAGRGRLRVSALPRARRAAASVCSCLHLC